MGWRIFRGWSDVAETVSRAKGGNYTGCKFGRDLCIGTTRRQRGRLMLLSQIIHMSFFWRIWCIGFVIPSVSLVSDSNPNY